MPSTDEHFSRILWNARAKAFGIVTCSGCSRSRTRLLLTKGWLTSLTQCVAELLDKLEKNATSGF